MLRFIVDAHIVSFRFNAMNLIDIKKEDIILHDGDIVFIESRDTEVFFTGGLLGGGFVVGAAGWGGNTR